MLTFLRQHQRLVFATAGLLVIFSMSFFGIASRSGNIDVKKNSVMGRAIDGSKMRSAPIDELAHFLNFSANPAVGLLKPSDDVMVNDVLKSGLGSMLVEAYYDELKEDIEPRLESYDRFKPYRHPAMSFISAENVWLKGAPQIFNAYHNYLEESDAIKKCGYVMDGYVEQAYFSEDQLRQILYFQERQFGRQAGDPDIVRGNLALFGIRSPSDLLGGKFLNLAAQFIHNGAIYAKQKGHKVSYQEARASLVATSEENFQAALSLMRMSERKVVQLWQKVLLFRRLFEEANGSIFLDALSYDHINRYMQENVQLNVYKMDDSFAVNDFEKMMKFELYLDFVAKRSNDTLIPLPTHYLSLDRVKSRCAKLLAKRFSVEVKEVPRSEIAMRVSFKELMEYETQNFETLKHKFAALTLSEADSLDAKLAVLEKLDPKVKEQLDQYARDQIVAANQQWVAAALDGKESAQKELLLNLDDVNSEFSGFSDNNVLINQLSKAYSAEQPVDLLGQEAFYRISVKDLSEQFEVLTFAEAESIGAMDRLLNDKLEREYSNARSAKPSQFKNASGEFKPLDEVREQIGTFVFSEAIAQLQNYLMKQGVNPSENLDELASYRMHHYLNEALTAIQADVEPDVYLYDPEENGDFEGQFKLMQEQTSISRSEPSPLSDEHVYRMKEDEWSSVALLPSYGLSFFHIDAKEINDDVRKNAMEEGFALLSEEACRVLLKDLLAEIQSHHAIHISEEAA